MHYEVKLANLHCEKCSSTLREIACEYAASDVKVSVEDGLFAYNSSEEGHERIVAEVKAIGFIVESGASDQLREQAERHRAVCNVCRELSVDEILAAVGQNTRTTMARPQLVKSEFHVDGMTCSSCVASIMDNALTHNAEIVSSNLTLIPPVATVVHWSSLSPSDIVGKIDDTGFEATLVASTPQEKSSETYTFESKLVIGGMTCTSCVSTVESAVTEIPGVTSLNLTLIPPVLRVCYENKETIDRIKDAIDDTGFEQEVVETRALDHRDDEKCREVHVTIKGMFCGNCVEAVNSLLDKYMHEKLIQRATSVTLVDDTPSNLTVWYEAHSGFSLTKFANDLAELGQFTVEPAKSTAQLIEELALAGQQRELRNILTRLIASFVFAIPTFFISVVFMSLVRHTTHIRRYFDHEIWGSCDRGTIALFFIATPIQFYADWPFLRAAVNTIVAAWKPVRAQRHRVYIAFKRRFLCWGSMDTLVALGTWVAYISSVIFMGLRIGSNDSTDRLHEHSETFFDTCVFLNMFILLGRYLELRTKSSVSSSILNLVGDQVVPSESQLESGRTLPTAFLELGDRVVVAHGSRIPIDGEVQSSGFVDESSLTGESNAVEKAPGDTVFAGTLNVSQRALIVVTTVWPGESTVDQVSDAMRSAVASKADIQRVADRITAVFVPAVAYAALITWAAWLGRCLSGHCPADWIGQPTSQARWIKFTISFSISLLVVACPCGIGLAAPTANVVGLSLALRNGVLGRGGALAFEKLSKVNVVAFDKTGTLTEGAPKISGIQTVGDHEFTQEDWDAIYSCELMSSHPLAKSIQDYCESKGATAHETNVEEIPGRGLIGSFSGYKLVLGNAKLAIEKGFHSDIDAHGKSLVYIGKVTPRESKLLGLISVEDAIRPEAKFVIEHFGKQGIQVYMLTGDGDSAALSVAREVGIPEARVYSNLLPIDKQSVVRELQQQEVANGSDPEKGLLSSTRKVLFVGDGVNDAAALAQADIAVSLDSGASIAQQASDFVILVQASTTPLLSLINGLSVVKHTRRRVLMNMVWACVFNTILIPLAGGAFYDADETRLPPVWSSVAMALSSISVVLSSLSLRWTFRPLKPPALNK